MTNQDRKTLAEALFAVAVENQSQKESRLAALEAENAKLRDLLRGEEAVAEECAKMVEAESLYPAWALQLADRIRSRFGGKA